MLPTLPQMVESESPRDCSQLDPSADEARNCYEGSVDRPLCEESPGVSAAGTTEYFAKAYPGLRHLAVLEDYGENSIGRLHLRAQRHGPHSTRFRLPPRGSGHSRTPERRAAVEYPSSMTHYPPLTSRVRAAAGALVALHALLLGAAGAEGAGGVSPSLPPRPQLHLFLLVGQSNMAGRGDIEPSDTEPIANVVALNAAGDWVPATDPLHWDKPSAGVGLARTFAIHYLQSHPGVTVGFIPAAVGGSPISSWAPGAYYEETESHPYDDALARARPALTRGMLAGILWHQGESDRSAELAPKYERALTDLIARFRRDLNAPRVPFLIGQLGQFAGAPWDQHAHRIDLAHRQVAARVPFTAFVPSQGLAAKPDHLHFDAPALRELGRRYAVAFAGLTARQTD